MPTSINRKEYPLRLATPLTHCLKRARDHSNRWLACRISPGAIPKSRLYSWLGVVSTTVGGRMRILGRARYSGRADDNVEAMKLRFDTFKAETVPTVELFKSKNKCVDVDTSQDRETVYSLLCDQLAEYTDPQLMAQPLSEKAEILLGLRSYPKNE